MDDTKYNDFTIIRAKLESKMINKIFDYLRTVGEIKFTQNNLIEANYIAMNFVDKGTSNANILLRYHNQLIENYIIECKEKLSKGDSFELIEGLLLYTDRIYFLIFWLNRIFSYLDRHHMKPFGLKSLGKMSMHLYESIFFRYFQNNIFIEIDKMINEERKGKKEFKEKIKRVMKIIRDIDLNSPKIIKKNNIIEWVENTTEKSKHSVNTEDSWFNEYFYKDTKKFLENKAIIDHERMSIGGYISTQMKYLEEEKERLNEYINPIYHNKINDLNYQILIRPYKKIKEKFENFFKEKESVKLKDPNVFIPQLMDFKLEMDKLEIEGMEKDKNFYYLINKEFNSYMSKDNYETLLSNYIDYCMCFDFKDKSKKEIDNELNKLIEFYKYLRDKSKFKNEITKKLSERIINNKSLSILNELNFIFKLIHEENISYVNEMLKLIVIQEENKNNIESYELINNSSTSGELKELKELIEKKDSDIRNLKKYIKEKEKILMKYEKEISLLKDEMNEKLKLIKNYQEEFVSKEMKNINKSLEAEIKNNLKQYKEKFDKFYEFIEIKINQKFQELNNLLKNNDINIEKQFEISKVKNPCCNCDLLENEYVLVLIITTIDEKVIYSITSKNTDNFKKVEDKFYQEYPEYLDKKGNFKFQNSLIDKGKTLEENKLRNNDIIIFEEFEE